MKASKKRKPLRFDRILSPDTAKKQVAGVIRAMRAATKKVFEGRA